jgi:hypothetical protein
MTRVMRNELLEVAANLLERDGLPRLARAVRSALSELAPTNREATAGAVLESIARGVLDDGLVHRLVALAETAEERAIADEVVAGGPTRVAAITCLAEEEARPARKSCRRAPEC